VHVRETGEWHREVALMIGGAAPASTWAPPYECPSSTTGTVDRANQVADRSGVSGEASHRVGGGHHGVPALNGGSMKRPASPARRTRS